MLKDQEQIDQINEQIATLERQEARLKASKKASDRCQAARSTTTRTTGARWTPSATGTPPAGTCWTTWRTTRPRTPRAACPLSGTCCAILPFW